MKKILSILFIACILWGCEDFLDSENKVKKSEENYPQSPSDASQLLTGVYSILSRSEPLGTPFLTSELMSDNVFGGGGPGDKSCKALDQFKKSGDDMFRQSWRAHYFGVYRSNFLISKLDDIDWDDETQANKIAGQVYYLRAHFYFELSLLFGEVPLVTVPYSVNIPQTPAAQTYAQIASDLKTAIEKLPATDYQNIDKDKDLGRVTKWAAEALMARVFLFYTGYYDKEALPLPDGGSITKQQVTDWLVDCIENSGHDLVRDFRNLWPYAYAQDYAYTKENNLKWEGDGNKETVFAIKYSTIANWDLDYQKCNHIALYLGLREQNTKRTSPFGIGWGMGTVNPKLWEDWDDADLRKQASIINVKDKKEIVYYANGGGSQMDETYYMQKKYTPIMVKNSEGVLVNYSCVLYNMTETNYLLTNTQDLVLMRFSDVLLMAAELGAPNAQNYLDRVRNRVGLPSVPVTLDNIKNERRFELAFEGVRYYDLLRWHDWNVITENQTDIKVRNNSVETQKTVTFRSETGGFLQIPKTEIELSGGVLKQNPGWEGTGNYLD